MMRKIGILFFTEKGGQLAEKLKAKSPENWTFCQYDKSKQKAIDFVEKNFNETDALVFIGAAGIAVRLIAPLITKKDKDPAVIVIDELGRFVIPILSGHIGGGNHLASETAKLIGAEAVITTATDINNRFAVDVWATENSCAVEEIDKIKKISAAVLADEPIGFYCSEFTVFGTMPTCFSTCEQFKKIGITVTLGGEEKRFEEELRIIPKIVTLGVGCRRDTDSEKFEQFILNNLNKEKISLRSIKNVASIDIKEKEECILNFCKKYDLPLKVYTAEELMTEKGAFHHSDFVEKTTGADNICERSASRLSGGKLIIRKTAAEGMTMAAARREWMCKF